MEGGVRWGWLRVREGRCEDNTHDEWSTHKPHLPYPALSVCMHGDVTPLPLFLVFSVCLANTCTHTSMSIYICLLLAQWDNATLLSSFTIFWKGRVIIQLSSDEEWWTICMWSRLFLLYFRQQQLYPYTQSVTHHAYDNPCRLYITFPYPLSTVHLITFPPFIPFN